MGLFGVPEELNAAVMLRLRGILPMLAALYLVLASVSFFLDGRSDGASAFWTGVLYGGVWAVLRRQWAAVRFMHPMAACVFGAALVHGVASVKASAATGESGAAAEFFLIILLSGATLWSLPWHGLVTGAAVTVWCVSARPVLAVEAWFYWLVVLLATAGLSAVNVQYRAWKQRRLAGTGVAPPEGMLAKEHFERAVAGTRDGLWYWELKSDVFHFSAAWAALLGYSPEELTKHPNEWLDRVHPGYLDRLRTELTAHLYGTEPQFRNEHRIRRKDGSYIWVLARGTVARNEAGEPAVLAGSHSDITPLIEAEKRILTDAFSDLLTGLPNRGLLMSHLDRAVEEKSSRGGAAPLFAVMFLDLDRFKFINDTMGHDVGDQLLIAVAARLRNCARPDDVVSRFGGDEFVLLLRNLRDAEEAVQVGRRILKALATPFQLGSRTVQSGGSVGIALSKETFANSDEILRFGDLAMYRAKALRNGEVQIFDPGMLNESKAKGELQGELATALERGQLVLHYQPFIHLATGKIVGAEALIRWQRSPQELLLPGEFLPLAEKSGMINQIGEWALRTACAQNSSWQRAGVSPVRMAVNLAASQLQQQDFAANVQRILKETNLAPEWLELELTEAALMRSMEVAPAALKELTDSGIRASIDDFGSGQASLSYLRQIQFHTMKMDRSFLNDVTTDAKAAAVARGLITLAHSLDLSVVAEGVERDEQFQFLSAERCDRVQGYFTGRPVPGDKMLELLKSRGGALETDLTRLHNAAQTLPGDAALRWAMERKARR